MRQEDSGVTGCMLGLIPIKEVMMYERIIPEEYINERGNDVTDAFVKWCRPLIGARTEGL
ncbi:MAG: hypothetical protein ACLTBV_19050 [Enterocloster bolteae]